MTTTPAEPDPQPEVVPSGDPEPLADPSIDPNQPDRQLPEIDPEPLP